MLVAGLVTACEGPAGQDGATGPAGPAGANGADGQNGEDGEDGSTGPNGQDGQDGEDGEDGTDGQDGQDGEDGEDGTNAYLTSSGLKLTLLGGGIEGTTAWIELKLTDSKDVGLDRNGRLTEGAIAPRITLAYLDETGGQVGKYVSYHLNAAGQASTDSGGVWTRLGEGHYRYQLKTAITVADPAKTHRFAVTATRAFQGQTYVDNAVFDFVPAGGTPKVREIVTDAACNDCHQSLALHGGQRRDIAVCITCHQPQTIDPDTGSTTDMTVMIHKIHRGHNLTQGYTVIGYGGAVHDYSHVTYPTDLKNCDTCHQGAMGDRWQTVATTETCTSCHDNIAFENPVPAGMVMHTAGARTDATCAGCHGPTDIATYHAVSARQLEYKILSIGTPAPGLPPSVRFSATLDGQPLTNLLTQTHAQENYTLAVGVAGPTTDYADYASGTVISTSSTTPNNPPTITVGTVTAVDGQPGVYEWTPPAHGKTGTTATAKAYVPAGATGTYQIFLEGQIRTATAASRIAATESPWAYFGVTDATPVARRVIVDDAKCDACHGDLVLHGTQRKTVETCVSCHHANNTNDDRVSRVEGQTVVAEPVHLKHMVHKLHMGHHLTGPYVLGANPAPTTSNPMGAPLNGAEITYPGLVNNCEGCHKAGTYGLPIAAGALPTAYDILTCTEDPAADTDAYCNTRTAERVLLKPETAACISCHDSVSTAIHAEVNQTANGESCATCHGAGKEYDVVKVHAVRP